jgi:hypothetical protein
MCSVGTICPEVVTWGPVLAKSRFVGSSGGPENGRLIDQGVLVSTQPPLPPTHFESQPVIPAYPATVVTPANGVAITAMVFGIIGAVVGFWAIVPVAGYISASLGFVPALVAVICGHIGLSRSKKLAGIGRKHAITGIITGYGSIGIMAVATLVWTLVLFTSI